MPFGIKNRSEFNLPFLSIDEDGELARLASPRTSRLASLEERINFLIHKFKQARLQEPNLGVALTVEELCPGGLDATDGILIAQALEKAGAKFFIASGGTGDFPALKYRRETKVQSESNHAWLASACWLLGRVKVPVYAQGSFSKDPSKQAKKAGFAGLVRL